MVATLRGSTGSSLALGALVVVSLVIHASAGVCDVEWGVDYEGGWNLNEGKQTYTGSDWDCCQLCQKNSQCKSWSRVKYTKGNLREGDCWLHGGGQSKKYKDWVNSGKKGGGDSCDIKWGLDLTGGHVLNNGKNDKTGSDWDCCQKCNAHSECKYWTRTKYWHQGSEEGECWLRKTIGKKIWNQDAFNSGEKH